METSWAVAMLETKTSILWTSVISATISALVAYFFRVREHKLKLLTEYEHEQRKALKETIGRAHGRFLHSCNSLNYRFWNLYKNHDKGWLTAGDSPTPTNYYLNSFVFRFMSVFVLVRQFEKQALFIDARIGNDQDKIFVKYVAALQWCMTDVGLFRGVSYDPFNPVDHFFSDSLRTFCEDCVDENGESLKAEAMLELGEKFKPVFLFFSGLSPRENRLRWDRLVSLHLIISTFINSIGYEEHQTSRKKLIKIASKIENKEILSNLAKWLPRHGLGEDPNSKKLIKVCKKISKKPAKKEGAFTEKTPH